MQPLPHCTTKSTKGSIEGYLKDRSRSDTRAISIAALTGPSPWWETQVQNHSAFDWVLLFPWVQGGHMTCYREGVFLKWTNTCPFLDLALDIAVKIVREFPCPPVVGIGVADLRIPAWAGHLLCVPLFLENWHLFLSRISFWHLGSWPVDDFVSPQQSHPGAMCFLFPESFWIIRTISGGLWVIGTHLVFQPAGRTNVQPGYHPPIIFSWVRSLIPAQVPLERGAEERLLFVFAVTPFWRHWLSSEVINFFTDAWSWRFVAPLPTSWSLVSGGVTSLQLSPWHNC